MAWSPSKSSAYGSSPASKHAAQPMLPMQPMGQWPPLMPVPQRTALHPSHALACLAQALAPMTASPTPSGIPPPPPAPKPCVQSSCVQRVRLPSGCLVHSAGSAEVLCRGTPNRTASRSLREHPRARAPLPRTTLEKSKGNAAMEVDGEDGSDDTDQLVDDAWTDMKMTDLKAESRRPEHKSNRRNAILQSRLFNRDCNQTAHPFTATRGSALGVVTSHVTQSSADSRESRGRRKLEETTAKVAAATADEQQAQRALDTFKQDFFGPADGEEPPADTDQQVPALFGELQATISAELLGRTSCLLDTLRGKSPARSKSPAATVSGDAQQEVGATAPDGTQTQSLKDATGAAPTQIPDGYAPAKATSARRHQAYDERCAEAQLSLLSLHYHNACLPRKRTCEAVCCFGLPSLPRTSKDSLV